MLPSSMDDAVVDVGTDADAGADGHVHSRAQKPRQRNEELSEHHVSHCHSVQMHAVDDHEDSSKTCQQD